MAKAVEELRQDVADMRHHVLWCLSRAEECEQLYGPHGLAASYKAAAGAEYAVIAAVEEAILVMECVAVNEAIGGEYVPIEPVDIAE